MNELPGDIQQRIDAQLQLGAFTNEAEVLREALEALERRQRGLLQLREMVAAADSDISSGRLAAFDRDNIKLAVRSRLAERGIRE
jgi:Arc/MetJ-type ribon-helix-helix transcriptional regulator